MTVMTGDGAGDDGGDEKETDDERDWKMMKMAR